MPHHRKAAAPMKFAGSCRHYRHHHHHHHHDVHHHLPRSVCRTSKAVPWHQYQVHNNQDGQFASWQIFHMPHGPARVSCIATQDQLLQRHHLLKAAAPKLLLAATCSMLQHQLQTQQLQQLLVRVSELQLLYLQQVPNTQVLEFTD